MVTQTKVRHSAKRQNFAFVGERVQYMFVGGIYTPNLYYIMTKIPLGCPQYSSNIPGKGYFLVDKSVQFDYLHRTVTLTLPRSSEVASGDLREPLLTFGSSPPPLGVAADLRIFTTTFGRRGWPSDLHHRLQASWLTFGSLPPPSGVVGDLRVFTTTFGSHS